MSSSPSPLVLHVSPTGNDQWSGTAPIAAGADGPFATLDRARAAIRALRQAGGEGGLRAPVTVLLRAGTHALTDPLVLTAADSGTREFPVTWTAYPGEQPVLSGGTQVTGWRPYRGHIVQAALPGAKGGKLQCRQLFWRGQRMPRARWPKVDPANPQATGWAFMEGPAEPGSMTAFRYRAGTFRQSWAKPTEGEVSVFRYVGWNMVTTPIRSLDPEARVIRLTRLDWDADVSPWYLPTPFLPDNRFCVENLLEELDRPGEWCLDREEGVLHFWPPADDLAEGDVVVPVLDRLVDLAGASWVTISGLTLSHTRDGDTPHPAGVAGCGAMALPAGDRYSGEALRLRGCTQCTVIGNHFRDVGGNAVYLEDENVRNAVCRNEISGAGANGIVLAGTRLRHPFANVITDNHIHHCGTINKYVAGIYCGLSDGNQIAHNLVEDLPAWGLFLGENPYGRNVVEYNLVRRVCLENADNAGLHCWMELPPREAERSGHVIRYNCFMDIYGCEVKNGRVIRSADYPTSGIYLDNYTSNCLIYGNLIVRCGMAGVLIHGGKNNVVENNVMVDCRQAVRLQDYIGVWLPYWKGMAGFMTGNRIERNLCYTGRADAVMYFLHAWTTRVLAACDRNLFFHTGGKPWAPEHDSDLVAGTTRRAADLPEDQRLSTLAAWQARGYDTESVFADPQFADPAHDDYRLLPNSPALALGFQPIAGERIGIRPGAQSPAPPPPGPPGKT